VAVQQQQQDDEAVQDDLQLMLLVEHIRESFHLADTDEDVRQAYQRREQAFSKRLDDIAGERASDSKWAKRQHGLQRCRDHYRELLGGGMEFSRFQEVVHKWPQLLHPLLSLQARFESLCHLGGHYFKARRRFTEKQLTHCPTLWEDYSVWHTVATINGGALLRAAAGGGGTNGGSGAKGSGSGSGGDSGVWQQVQMLRGNTMSGGTGDHNTDKVSSENFASERGHKVSV
jgi:hypothetical protein